LKEQLEIDRDAAQAIVKATPFDFGLQALPALSHPTMGLPRRTSTAGCAAADTSHHRFS
jgi:hypothetical protein